MLLLMRLNREKEGRRKREGERGLEESREWERRLRGVVLRNIFPEK